MLNDASLLFAVCLSRDVYSSQTSRQTKLSAVLNFRSCYICFCLFPFVFVSYWLYYLCI